MITWIGFEKAYIGAAWRCGCSEPIAVYNYEMMCTILITRDKMTPDEAVEYIDFNVLNAWVGEDTPYILINDFDGVVDSSDAEPEQKER